MNGFYAFIPLVLLIALAVLHVWRPGTPKATDNSISYLAELADRSRTRRSLDAIRDAIEQRGYWEEMLEWRISTVTALRIERTAHSEPRFLVRAECDNKFETVCPTIERALEFLGIYERLIQDLYWTVGWPSCASKQKLKASAQAPS